MSLVKTIDQTIALALSKILKMPITADLSAI